MIHVRRVYDPPAAGEGRRFLVERLWPRGVRRDALQLTAWLKEVAPSPALRRWFAHDPEKWEAFCQRYTAELDANPAAWQPLLEAARQGPITLLYSARDREHNSAVVLKAYLQAKLKQEGR
ncbi:MAG: hypothetical protein KatS3mg131_3603 [Candidatus Tectimicrobiota bacterium]|nr:MAG: hypothetical protein KatS3mg131_3603 [Candidatus Tectomicrobia bacterium]